MPHARVVLTSAALAAAVCLTLGGCAAAGRPGGPSAPDRSAAGDAGDAGELAGELRIFAAASLAAAFDELAARFEQQHPSVDVLPVAYDGSATLATQLIEGAPADVFAAADERTMQQVVDAGLAAAPVLFAGNTLVIAVPKDNPGGVKTIEDLGWPGTTVVLCAPQVPCGSAAETLLADNGVSVTPVSLEQNVTAVLIKVAAGEADAGLVYATDARASDDVRAVAAAGAERIVNRYPIAAMREAANAAAAEAFVAYVRSDEAQALLASLGFASP